MSLYNDEMQFPDESRSPILKRFKTATGVISHSRSSSESCLKRSRSPTIVHTRSRSLPSPITSPDFQYIFDSDGNDDLDESFVNLARDLEDDLNSCTVDLIDTDLHSCESSTENGLCDSLYNHSYRDKTVSNTQGSLFSYDLCPTLTRDARDDLSEAPRLITAIDDENSTEQRSPFLLYNQSHVKKSDCSVEQLFSMRSHQIRGTRSGNMTVNSEGLNKARPYPITPGDQTVFSVVSREIESSYELSPSSQYDMSCKAELINNHDDSRYFRGNILLALPEDEFTLNELHCFIRENVEAFTATEEDVASRHSKGVQKLYCDQVGVRCIHCKNSPPKDRANQAVSYPSTISGISQTAFDMQRHHFGACKDLPSNLKSKFFELKNSSYRKRSSRWYWIDAAKKLGLVDTPKGIRFAYDPRNVVHQPLSFHKNGSLINSFYGKNDSCIIKTPLVLPEDKPLITDFLELVMKQMLPCKLTEECGRHTDRPIGFPGLACMHCFGPGGFGKYFPSTPATLKDNNTATRFYLHMLKCRRCPSDIKQRLAELHQTHASESARLKLGSKKKFFHRVWNRLHGKSDSSLSRTDNVEVGGSVAHSENDKPVKVVGIKVGSTVSFDSKFPGYHSSYNIPNNKSIVALEEMDDWLSQVMPFQKARNTVSSSTTLFAEL